MINQFFKSLIDNDNTAIVICSLDHTIVYINPAAKKRYEKRGGENLVGKCLLDCHNGDSVKRIYQIVEWFEKSIDNNRVHTFFNEKENMDGYMIALRNQDGSLIGYYEKHEYRSRDMSKMYGYT